MSTILQQERDGRDKRRLKQNAELLASAALESTLDRESKERAARQARGPPSGLHVVLRRWQVEQAVGLGRSAIYKLMAAGQFPLPVKLTGRAVGWKRADIEQWLAERPPSRPARLKERPFTAKPRVETDADKDGQPDIAAAIGEPLQS